MSTLRMPFIIAHRGASAAHPENTLEAFVGALAEGADWVELDVRLSGDGQLVVHHDAWYSDGLGIAACSADARPASVPLLAEALDACAGMGVNIEIKNSPGDLGDEGPEHGLEVAELVVSLVTERGSGQSIQVSSFDEPTLARSRSSLRSSPPRSCCSTCRPTPRPWTEPPPPVTVRSTRGIRSSTRHSSPAARRSGSRSTRGRSTTPIASVRWPPSGSRHHHQHPGRRAGCASLSRPGRCARR